MAKLKLNPEPTFQGKVDVHVPGGEPATVVFTFKHRTREELTTFLPSVKGLKNDVELIMAVATGWDLEDEFNRKNVATLVKNYIKAPSQVFDAYLNELTGARAKN